MYITGVKQKYQRKNLKVQEEEYKFPSSCCNPFKKQEEKNNYVKTMKGRSEARGHNSPTLLR